MCGKLAMIVTSRVKVTTYIKKKLRKEKINTQACILSQIQKLP